MGFFTPVNEDTLLLDEEFDMDAYNEACFFLEAMALPEEDRKLICESQEAAILESKGKISRKTIIRLNKQDDMERRITVACYQLAKDHNDPLWAKLVKATEQKNKFKSAIIKKYRNKATRAAKTAQKEYLKHPVQKLLKVADLSKTREK